MLITDKDVLEKDSSVTGQVFKESALIPSTFVKEDMFKSALIPSTFVKEDTFNVPLKEIIYVEICIKKEIENDLII